MGRREISSLSRRSTINYSWNDGVRKSMDIIISDESLLSNMILTQDFATKYLFLKKIKKKRFFKFLFSERRKGREKKRERNINQLPLICPQLGTWHNSGM